MQKKKQRQNLSKQSNYGSDEIENSLFLTKYLSFKNNARTIKNSQLFRIVEILGIKYFQKKSKSFHFDIEISQVPDAVSVTIIFL